LNDTNNKVIDLIKGRLELGQKKYGGSIPIRGEGGRDNLKESIEEVLDLAVYLGATLLELEEERRKEKQSKEQHNSFKIDVSDIKMILKGLHKQQEEAYMENQLQESANIMTLINGIKSNCNWCHEDDKSIRQLDNPMHNVQKELDEKKPFTKCIEGSNCD
tara:strand:+ start:230 stop:712 length:483 start_codon:yes stop_codon:yes gene_type:complete